MPMQIQDLFLKPLHRSINGVVKADQKDRETVYQELDEYVVTNELETHFRAFFESYATPLDAPSIANRVGVWISGFFGSGKSHFLKVLSYLLANVEAEDEAGNQRRAADFFDEQKLQDAMIRADVAKAVQQPADVILFNIDSKAGSNDDGNPILNVFLRVFNEYQGFSGDHPHIAHMERHLAQRGVLERFREAFKAASGLVWEDERDGYQFYQDDIEQAISQALELSPEAAHKWFEESEHNFSVSVESFCRWVKDYLDAKSPTQRIAFMVDEVGQFIGSDTRLMLTLQTLTENLGTICGGRAWIVVTSQADMDAVLGEMTAAKANDFSKIAGRFKTRLSLSSSNSDEVIRKRLLPKTPEAAGELARVYDEQGTILRNQLTFDRSGPTLKNVEDEDSFIANYPFVPYHFQLVQKVFEEIRKVGATGAHLAYGERSMLDAFQMAAKDVSDRPVGTLVPMHSFYRAVEGFLDTAVKRTIDQASENTALDEGDVEVLRTLFMIRYVDLVKGTLDNLVTLSITRIDDDRLAIRERLEGTLARLEKESLVTRNGEEFLFLTNEERDITRQIKATEITSSDENKLLADMIYRDRLRDRNKYRYPLNKTDYSIGRYLDGHTIDGRLQGQLRVEVVSPLDIDYTHRYSVHSGETGCLHRSGEDGGQVLIRLGDSKAFFDDLRTYIKTEKFIRLNSASGDRSIERILTDRGRENQERRKHLLVWLEERLRDADIYALGQKLELNNSQLASRLDDACQYLLENTYTKLGYLEVLTSDPMRELLAVMTADDIGQQAIDLDGEEGNPQAVREVEQYIGLHGSEPVPLNPLLERFSNRPFGWPADETLLVLGRLYAAGRLTFHTSGAALAGKEAFELLNNSRRRSEVRLHKKRQTDDAVLRQVRNLTKDLFSKLGPTGEAELYAFYIEQFSTWKKDLEAYRSKTDVGHFPGRATIDSTLKEVERLLRIDDSFDFFKAVAGRQEDLLDLEEDYRDLHEFFTKQLTIWNQLQQALNRFAPNRTALEKDSEAKAALAELDRIYASDAPYGMLQKVAGLIHTVDQTNTQLLEQKRENAVGLLDKRIARVSAEIVKSGIGTSELSNRLLRPLQLLKQDIDATANIAQIYMLQSDTANDCELESLDELYREQQAEAERQRAASQQVGSSTADNGAASNTNTQADSTSQPEHGTAAKAGSGPATSVDEVREPATVAAPKPVTSVSVSEVLSRSHEGVYLESQQEVDAFLDALRNELDDAIRADKRIRLR
ncbi:MAG: BREX system P-loop protein BrxC [Halomonas sp.]|nr:BREX system P-loop protein BrxC [Halomonas sp.]MDN6298469.1 BREX system P-loop protein BrxC [Halomonas sp.]MDN6315638.1 BREX system P-loop protein BrxC [Halomonas sp.]MDN6337059.1 BREX system P-loop protein BrxC [Halomonas sp.]